MRTETDVKTIKFKQHANPSNKTDQISVAYMLQVYRNSLQLIGYFDVATLLLRCKLYCCEFLSKVCFSQ